MSIKPAAATDINKTSTSWVEMSEDDEVLVPLARTPSRPQPSPPRSSLGNIASPSKAQPPVRRSSVGKHSSKNRFGVLASTTDQE